MEQRVDSANGSASGVKDTLQQAAQQTQEHAGRAASQATGAALSQIESRKQQAAVSLGALAQALRDSGSELQEQQPLVGSSLNRAADGIERISSSLWERDVEQIIAEGEQAVRSNPWLALGGAFALGMLAARFLRASQPMHNMDDGEYHFSHVQHRYEDVRGIPLIARGPGLQAAEAIAAGNVQGGVEASAADTDSGIAT